VLNRSSRGGLRFQGLAFASGFFQRGLGTIYVFTYMKRTGRLLPRIERD